MGLRDELKKKARLGLKSFLKRMDDFGEAVFGEEKKEETVEPKPGPNWPAGQCWSLSSES